MTTLLSRMRSAGFSRKQAAALSESLASAGGGGSAVVDLALPRLASYGVRVDTQHAFTWSRFTAVAQPVSGALSPFGSITLRTPGVAAGALTYTIARAGEFVRFTTAIDLAALTVDEAVDLEMPRTGAPAPSWYSEDSGVYGCGTGDDEDAHTYMITAELVTLPPS